MTIEPIYIGSFGALLIIIAFTLNQFQKWQSNYFIYNLFNLIGSLSLLYYAVIGINWPFIILNGFWSLVALRSCIIGLIRNSRKPNSLGSWNKWMK